MAPVSEYARPFHLPGCEKGPAMITVSTLTILVSAVALICVVSMMLHLRGEATRKRVDKLEQRVAELSSLAKERNL